MGNKGEHRLAEAITGDHHGERWPIFSEEQVVYAPDRNLAGRGGRLVITLGALAADAVVAPAEVWHMRQSKTNALVAAHLLPGGGGQPNRPRLAPLVPCSAKDSGQTAAATPEAMTSSYSQSRPKGTILLPMFAGLVARPHSHLSDKVGPAVVSSATPAFLVIEAAGCVPADSAAAWPAMAVAAISTAATSFTLLCPLLRQSRERWPYLPHLWQYPSNAKLSWRLVFLPFLRLPVALLSPILPLP